MDRLIIELETLQLQVRYSTTKRKNEKEEYLYIAILVSLSKRSDMDHAVLRANYTMSAFPL